MAVLLKKLGLVMWKNLIIRKRHWLLTIIEIVIPVLLFIVIALIRSKGSESIENLKPATFQNILNEDDLVQISVFQESEIPLLFAPKTNFTQTIMERVASGLAAHKNVQGFETEDDLIHYYDAINDTMHDIHAVVFQNLSKSGIPHHLKYKLRLSRPSVQTSRLFPEFQGGGPGSSGDSYRYSGFLGLQYLIDKMFIKMVGGSNVKYEATMQQFPYPEYHEDSFVDIFSVFLPLFTVLSYVTLCPAILKRVVEEKESGVKELMKMMGLKNWMLWLGWLLNALLVSIISITIITWLLKWPFGELAVLHYSDPVLIWLFLLLYFTAGVVFCFAISTLSSRPTLIMSVGVILWFLSYGISSSLVASPGYVASSIKLLSSLLPNTAISWGYRMMVAYESKSVGLHWDNLFSPPSGIKGDISVGLMLLMFIVDIIIYGILTWYIDSIMPGQYGLAKPWYFVFMPSYWRSSKVDDLTFSPVDDPVINTKFEKPPSNRKTGIKIQNLRKVFQSIGGLNKKVAVDGVTLDIYKGEITALLGHNGAGKTTTMSILTGMFSATSGSVHIDGYDINGHLDKVRESLGLCPQHNLLFPDLTVLEHLVFFAMLKGCSKAEANSEAKNLINRLNLADKTNKLSTTLSGGMKRKLALGMALIGHTKVLMLDEPTSGMDPEARREIWDLLLSMRGERTILITTHFMEEADVLGDRIAIMDHGRVQCYGTSLFLKKLYGTGYQLNLLKYEGFNVDRITEIVVQHVPGAEIKSQMGSSLSYMLPSEQSSLFPELFDRLEREKQALGITSIGVSITTLEEVFLKVGKEAEDELDGPTNSDSSVEYVKLNGSSEVLSLDDQEHCDEETSLSDKVPLLQKCKRREGHLRRRVTTNRFSCDTFREDFEALTFKKTVGTGLLIQQFTSLLSKRVMFTLRKWITFLIQVLIAILMAVLTVTLSASTGSLSEPARTMNLSDYDKSRVLFSVDPGLENFSNNFVGLTHVFGATTTKVKDVTKELMQIGESDIPLFRDKYIVAAEFNKSKTGTAVMNALFSSIAIHSPPISLNLISNTILQTVLPGRSITVVNHPLEIKELVLGADLLRRASVITLWLTLMPFGLLFLTASFLTFPLVERVSKAKQLQLMTGASPLTYWLSCFLWDIFLYLIVIGIMLIIVFCADPLNVFNGKDEIGTLTLLLLTYGISAIPFAYLFSYFKNSNAGAFALLVVLNLLVGLIMSLVVYFMMFSEYYLPTAKILKYIFEFIPHFTITYAFTQFSSQVLNNNYCKLKKSYCDIPALAAHDTCCLPSCKSGICPELYKPYLAFANDDNMSAVGGEIIFMAVDSIIYFVLILLVEIGLFTSLYEYVMKNVNLNISKLLATTEEINKELDEDVLKEQDRVDGHVRVSSHNHSEDIMLVYNLTKNYTRTFTAVKGISFGVAPGECFGLLGVNGAGKTTTFKMLTGDEIPTTGEAWINQFSLSRHKSKFLSQIGYCPQFDAINESLTGREMLRLFANLRGVSQANTEYEVNKWIALMGLREYEHRQCGTYSGGNKRKLSTAMALIGDPPIVFLDEPTSGVDPVARRNLWTVLTTIQKSGQSVVLTSHSMEECEALCNRLAIMVSGHFMCMGGIQYLKQKFGQGFTVMVKLRVTGDDQILNRLKNEIQECFMSGCVLKDEHQGLLHYHVTDPNTPWSHLFTTMERLKQDSSIVEDYTISETTLEQVFLSFARVQSEEPVVNF